MLTLDATESQTRLQVFSRPCAEAAKGGPLHPRSDGEGTFAGGASALEQSCATQSVHPRPHSKRTAPPAPSPSRHSIRCALNPFRPSAHPGRLACARWLQRPAAGCGTPLGDRRAGQDGRARGHPGHNCALQGELDAQGEWGGGRGPGVGVHLSCTGVHSKSLSWQLLDPIQQPNAHLATVTVAAYRCWAHARAASCSAVTARPCPTPPHPPTRPPCCLSPAADLVLLLQLWRRCSCLGPPCAALCAARAREAPCASGCLPACRGQASPAGGSPSAGACSTTPGSTHCPHCLRAHTSNTAPLFPTPYKHRSVCPLRCAVFFLPYVNLFYRKLGFTEQQIGVLCALKPWVSAPAGGRGSAVGWQGLRPAESQCLRPNVRRAAPALKDACPFCALIQLASRGPPLSRPSYTFVHLPRPTPPHPSQTHFNLPQLPLQAT